MDISREEAERLLREQLGDEEFERIAPTLDLDNAVIVPAEQGVAPEDPNNYIYEEWRRMYPRAYGPWIETDEDCKDYPDCGCNGKRIARQIFQSHLN